MKTDFETKANIVAYDADGNLMKVDIIPDTLKASVKVSQTKQRRTDHTESNRCDSK